MMASSGLMNLAFLGVAAVVSLVGVTILWLVRRKPRSMEAGMRAFSRELEALAPPDAKATRAEAHVDHVTPAPIQREGHQRTGRQGGRARRSSRSRAGAPVQRDGSPPPRPQE
jgi:hypothetical protein